MTDIVTIGEALANLASRMQTERANAEEERDALLQALNGVRNMLVNAADRLSDLEKKITAVHEGRVSAITKMIGGDDDKSSPAF